MAILIDSDVLIDWERGTAPTLPAEARAISVVTASELLHGVHRSEGAARVWRSAFTEYVLQALPVIPITVPVARAHSQIWASLEAGGLPIGAHDLWIAATALAHDFAVATRNAAQFGRVEGLRVIDLG